MNGRSIYSIDGVLSIPGEQVLSSTLFVPLSANQSGCTVSLYNESDKASETPIGSVDLTYSSAEDLYTLSLDDISDALAAGKRYSGQITKTGIVPLTLNTFVINTYNTVEMSKLNKILGLLRAITSGRASEDNLIRQILQIVLSNNVKIEEAIINKKEL